MKIICQNHIEFFSCLDDEHKVYQDAIHVSINSIPLDTDDVKFEIILKATVVVIVDSGEVNETQYLLALGMSCGKDYRDSTNTKAGTVYAHSLKDMIKDYCQTRKWKVRGGEIEE